MNLKKYIIEKSKQIGIDIIGFTDADQLDSKIADDLALRRDKKYETEFEEDNIEKRTDPRHMLKSGKSIIVIGVSYYRNLNEGPSVNERNKARGRLSKSAIGLDYHIVLKDKMESLVDEIKKLDEDFEYKIGVDTTPLLDRQLAKKAGIGWQGKNAMIINEEYGSFIFLGYIITDLTIEKDIPIEDKCLECNICVRSCPVGAIKQDHELNARRCISYLTQTKEDIPYKLREKMSDKIYGCDTCQLVCPKNYHMIENTVKTHGENLLEYIDIEELFNMSNKQFKNKYGDLAFSWRGKNVIKRNAIIILGNSKDKENISLLKQALKDQSLMIRKYSAWALLMVDRIEGLEILENHKKFEKDQAMIEEIEKLKEYFARS